MHAASAAVVAAALTVPKVKASFADSSENNRPADTTASL